MTTPHFSSKSPTIRRILREAAEISHAPSPDYTAEPLESDLFEWHFTLRGPPNSVYGEGLYHGRIVLPPSYPLRPPSFRFTTPNGRFEANREICLSISGHHEETWQPAWGIRTAIVALRSFMETDARGQLGGLDTPDAVRRRLAAESASFKCSTCSKTNQEIIKECENRASESDSSRQDDAVPQDLKLAWRDELEAKKPSSTNTIPAQDLPAQQVLSSVQDSAELAEGFVQTGPPPPAAHSSAPAGLPPGTPAVAPTSTHPPHLQAAADQLQQPATDGVPLWIDRAIVALVVLLVAIVLKVMLAV